MRALASIPVSTKFEEIPTSCALPPTTATSKEPNTILLDERARRGFSPRFSISNAGVVCASGSISYQKAEP